MNTKPFELKAENIYPSKNFMLVSSLSGDEKTKSGIIIPNAAFNGAVPTVGEVFRAGSDSKYKSGSVVLFRKYSVDEVAFGLEKYMFVTDDDIIAEVKEKDGQKTD